jgi:hypothetical protein
MTADDRRSFRDELLDIALSPRMAMEMGRADDTQPALDQAERDALAGLRQARDIQAAALRELKLLALDLDTMLNRATTTHGVIK